MWKALSPGEGAGSCINGKGVASLVLGMSGMALEPVELDPVHGTDPEETHPEVRILDFCEPLALPLPEPTLVDGIHDIR